MVSSQSRRDFTSLSRHPFIKTDGHISDVVLFYTTMASYFGEHSASASIPASTSPPLLYSFQFPPFLSLASTKSATWLYTTAVIILSLLALEQTVYRYKKRHLPGATWTIPVIGKFADSMKPTMEGYKAQWDSGSLSAISVFNM
jgi:C-22 sterol desaturase